MSEQNQQNANEISLPLAKRNALVLGLAVAFTGSVAPIAVSTGGLAGHFLLGEDKSWATAPVTGFNVGMALGAFVASLIMRYIGRKYGFITGALCAVLGGALATVSLLGGQFMILTIGLVCIGIGMAFSNQYRFAAADGSPINFKAQAISWVAMGGIFAAVIGPQTAILLKDYFAPIPFAGSFAGIIPVVLMGAAILMFLNVPNDKPDETQASVGEDARPLMEIVSQPRFIIALLCGICAFAMMTFMMTGAPLAMMICGFSSDQSTLGIQWHVLAMYGPSFFTGKLITRYGADHVTGAGLFIMIICAIIGFMGIELWNFWLALVLLGVGWNFGFIGATAMVTTTYRDSERSKVQGFHDSVLFSIVALASLGAGQVLNAWGWQVVTGLMWPTCGLCLLALMIYSAKERRQTTAAAAQ